MSTKSIIFVWVNILFFCFNMASAQDEISPDVARKIMFPEVGMVQVITLDTGSKLTGRIIDIRDDEITFDTDLFKINLPKNKIIDIEMVPIGTVTNSSHWFDNPNTTRLFFAPTGRMLKKGQGYFSDYMLFFPGIAYGVSDNFTIGGGMTLIPFIDFNEQIFYFSAKAGLKALRQFSIAAGVLVFSLPEINDRTPKVGILYGVGTFGRPDVSLSGGFGYGFVDDDIAEKPMLMVGGEKRLSRRISFVTENWVFPGVDNPLISYGFRFFGEGLSVDLALLNTLDYEMSFPGFPWIDFVFNF